MLTRNTLQIERCAELMLVFSMLGHGNMMLQLATFLVRTQVSSHLAKHDTYILSRSRIEPRGPDNGEGDGNLNYSGYMDVHSYTQSIAPHLAALS